MLSSKYDNLFDELIANFNIEDEYADQLKQLVNSFDSESEYANRLDELIANFDVETNVLLSPPYFLKHLTRALNSEAAFIAMPNNGSNKLDVPYVYTENNVMNEVKNVKSSTLSEVIEQNESITVNEEEDIEDELREFAVKSMLAVPLPLPDKTGALAVCNRKTPLKFGVMYVSYDVKICSMIASLLSSGPRMFEEHFQLTVREFKNLKSDVNELKDTVKELTKSVRTLAQPSPTGIVMTDFVRERDAYLRMEKELLEKYPGQFVGIYKGELVAVNSDKIKLIEEIRKKKGNVRAFIRKVTKEQPRIKLPTSRKMTK